MSVVAVSVCPVLNKEYENYCKNVPRVFPKIRDCLNANLRDVMNLDEAFSTKEKRGLIFWPLLAVGLETIQEVFIYTQINLIDTLILFVCAIAFFSLIFLIKYVSK